MRTYLPGAHKPSEGGGDGPLASRVKKRAIPITLHVHSTSKRGQQYCLKELSEGTIIITITGDQYHHYLKPIPLRASTSAYTPSLIPAHATN